MAMDSQQNEQGKDDEQKGVILEEIPENLIRFASLMIKTFYGKEHYIVLDYVQRNKCIKEDDLRQLIKFDQRFLRTVLMQLKVDKILKERLVSEEAEGRSRKVNYYFINYKALLNVAKYKIDHMRQRLEVKDKDEVHKASYRCTGCQYQYDAMEMDKIFDPLTQELICWRCQQTVEPDETAGPTDETRSSLARFNEQMAPFFSMIQSLYGIRLARHLLEPPIKVADGGFNEPEAKRVAAVGERSFNEQTTASRSTMYQNGIMVSIVEEGATPKVEPKKLVPWLNNNQKDEQATSAFAISSDSPSDFNETVPSEPIENDIDSLLVTEFEEAKPETSVAEEKTQEPVGGGDLNEPANMESDDEDAIFVAGKKYYLDEITPELVSQMSAAEKEAYIQRTQEDFDY